MLNLRDISRTLVTSSKHCLGHVRTLDFTRCVVALPACICFAGVSSLDAGISAKGHLCSSLLKRNQAQRS